MSFSDDPSNDIDPEIYRSTWLSDDQAPVHGVSQPAFHEFAVSQLNVHGRLEGLGKINARSTHEPVAPASEPVRVS